MLIKKWTQKIQPRRGDIFIKKRTQENSAL